jgi:hypothetical protein
VNTLPAADLQRLSKLLEVVLRDSTPDGERTAATVQAIKMLDRYAMRWSDVVTQLQAAPPKREPIQSTWRTVCERLQQRPGDLRPWERGFVADLPNFKRISSKQRYCLDEIAKRVLGEAAP